MVQLHRRLYRPGAGRAHAAAGRAHRHGGAARQRPGGALRTGPVGRRRPDRVGIRRARAGARHHRRPDLPRRLPGHGAAPDAGAATRCAGGAATCGRCVIRGVSGGPGPGAARRAEPRAGARVCRRCRRLRDGVARAGAPACRVGIGRRRCGRRVVRVTAGRAPGACQRPRRGQRARTCPDLASRDCVDRRRYRTRDRRVRSRHDGPGVRSVCACGIGAARGTRGVAGPCAQRDARHAHQRRCDRAARRRAACDAAPGARAARCRRTGCSAWRRRVPVRCHRGRGGCPRRRGAGGVRDHGAAVVVLGIRRAGRGAADRTRRRSIGYGGGRRG